MDRGVFAPDRESPRPASRRPGPRGSAGAGPTFATSPFLATIPRDDDGDARGRGEGRSPHPTTPDSRVIQSAPRGQAPDVREAVRQGGRRANAPGGTDRANAPPGNTSTGVRAQRRGRRQR